MGLKGVFVENFLAYFGAFRVLGCSGPEASSCSFSGGGGSGSRVVGFRGLKGKQAFKLLLGTFSHA